MQFTSRLTGEFSHVTTSELDGETACQNTRPRRMPPRQKGIWNYGVSCAGNIIPNPGRLVHAQLIYSLVFSHREQEKQ